VWGENEFPTTRTIDMHVLNLRKKLEVEAAKPRHLITEHGVGYKFVP
jgi:DNA-binding response OmpR family regulator